MPDPGPVSNTQISPRIIPHRTRTHVCARTHKNAHLQHPQSHTHARTKARTHAQTHEPSRTCARNRRSGLWLCLTTTARPQARSQAAVRAGGIEALVAILQRSDSNSRLAEVPPTPSTSPFPPSPFRSTPSLHQSLAP